MKKSFLAVSISMMATFGVQADLIQHTDQIAEIKFTGSTYELGKHVGEVGKEQILDGIQRFDDTLGVMLPGLNVKGLSATFAKNDVFNKLVKSSPDAGRYIQGLSESLDLDPNYLLAVGMSDEAILESQRNGGVGFLQAEKPAHDPSAPAKCTAMAVKSKDGKSWVAHNFDYMGVNYDGLMMLNHTDVDGKTRIIQTWIGLIPYGGVTKGAQAFSVNTMADSGLLRQNAGGEILDKNAIPSFYLSWDAYNAQSYDDVVDVFTKYPKYTAFFTYTLAAADQPAMNIENVYGGKVNVTKGDWVAHSNHTIKGEAEDFVDENFAANSMARLAKAQEFVSQADANTPKNEIRQVLESKPLWKGRGEMMGTVTSTVFKINGEQVDMFIKTDEAHPEVHIKNY
ncbi:C45 family autoproteolytic acyltransferase/hydolase [Vibrio alfacsensis]|uniref:C45 family autoproteolytic acyltransferase/hydolase n=1 Tax=Vibrio alfacsensis TaxID=1074311 RepID=UPI001C808DAB|nr:C45 family autoproteolytic acyltransferase/hydolase [Vibrio alfacsensis]